MNPIHVVLYRSIYPRNVGMCARAMANMNCSRLILVGTEVDPSTEVAKQGAAHAQSFLRNATLYASHDEFVAKEGEGIRIALSGREGRLHRPEFLDCAFQRMKDEPENPIHSKETPIYLIFGPEDYGLSNEDMALTHWVCRLPTFGEITSLNLSHAVLLATYIAQTALGTPVGEEAYETNQRSSAATTSAKSENPETQTTLRPVYYPSETIARWLTALGFDLSARRVSIEKTLNRILLSRCPTPEELRVVDSVLQQTVRKLESSGPS